MEYRYLGADVHALGIHRASLFRILFDAVQDAGIRIVNDCRLSGATIVGNRIMPEFGGRPPVDQDFDLIIDASGAGSPLSLGKSYDLPYAALWTTVDDVPGTQVAVAALDQRYLGARRMAGAMPIGINPATGNAGVALFWSIKPSDLAALHQRGLAHWQQEFIALWPEAEPFVMQVPSLDALTLAIYRHRTGKPFSQGGIFHVGDSWHCTSPQLGQGANMALIDAAAIAEALRSNENLPVVAHAYKHARSGHVRLYQILSRVFTPLYQSDSKLLARIRNWTIHYAARLPLVRTLIAHVVSGNFGNFGH